VFLTGAPVPPRNDSPASDSVGSGSRRQSPLLPLGDDHGDLDIRLKDRDYRVKKQEVVKPVISVPAEDIPMPGETPVDADLRQPPVSVTPEHPSFKLGIWMPLNLPFLGPILPKSWTKLCPKSGPNCVQIFDQIESKILDSKS
jgi:hypothetical protein